MSVYERYEALRGVPLEILDDRIEDVKTGRLNGERSTYTISFLRLENPPKDPLIGEKDV